METVIRANLALAIRLVDTTTGRAMDGTDVRFMRNDLPVRPMYRGDATWVFVGPDRENFSLCVRARDYEDADVQICYEELDPKLPMCEVFLIPSEKNRRGSSVLGIYGTLPELKSIDAILLLRPVCMYRDCTEKKGVVRISLFPAAGATKVQIYEGSYALVAEDGQSYEKFTVVRQDTPASAILKAGLSRAYRADCRIYRPTFGRASPDGSFIFRGRDDGSTLPYLLRFEVGETTWFRTFDLQQEHGEIDLMAGAAQAVDPMTGKEGTQDE